MSCGYAGMSLSDFWKSEIRHIMSIIQGKHLEHETASRSRLIAARLTAWQLTNIALLAYKPRKQFETPQDLLPFTFEKELIEQRNKTQGEENAARLERMKAVMQRDLDRYNKK